MLPRKTSSQEEGVRQALPRKTSSRAGGVRQVVPGKSSSPASGDQKALPQKEPRTVSGDYATISGKESRAVEGEREAPLRQHGGGKEKGNQREAPSSLPGEKENAGEMGGLRPFDTHDPPDGLFEIHVCDDLPPNLLWLAGLGGHERIARGGLGRLCGYKRTARGE